MKRTLVGMAVLIALAVILYPWLRPARPLPRPLPASVDFVMANELHLVAVPSDAVRPSIFQDPVLRVVSRVKWGRPEQLNYTQRHLPADRERLAQRLVELLDDMSRSSPLGARAVVDFLGVLAQPCAESILMRLASAPPDYLQLSAITALAQYPENRDIDLLLADLSSSEEEQVSRAAIQAVLQRSFRFGDQGARLESINRMLQAAQGAEALPILDECFRRNLSGTADAVALHLDSQRLLVRQQAIRALLRFRDERGLAAARAELESSDADRIRKALEAFQEAGVGPGVEAARRLSMHAASEVKLALAGALQPTELDDDSVRDADVNLLHFLAEDTSISVRRRALQSLFAHGDATLLGPMRESLASGNGEALKESVTFVCEVLHDPVAGEYIRKRLEVESDAQNEASLLFGLRFVGSARDAPFFVDRMLAAGTERDRLAGRVTWLSDYAAQYVATLGSVIVDPLFEALARADNDRARLAVIDAIRSVATDVRQDQRDALLSWIDDPSRSERVRIAAAESAPFFEDPALSQRILDLSRSVENRAVALRLQEIFLNYF